MIVDGRQVSGTAFQHGGFRAQEIGHVVHPRFVPVLSDPEAFLGLRHGRFGNLDTLPGGLKAGVGASHLQPDCRIRPLLVGFGALYQVRGFRDSGLVGRSIEQVPAEGNSGQPVGSAAVDEPLAIRALKRYVTDQAKGDAPTIMPP